jgi:hypothetical protein
MSMTLRLIAFAALLLAGLVPAAAQAAEPDVLVRGFYRAYEKAGAEPSATRLVRPHASGRLGGLLARDEQCAKKSREPCSLDFDFIVNGQDFEIANVRIAPPAIVGEGASVTARFSNFGTPNEIVYSFVREGGAWRLDDVEARAPRESRWRLSRLLAPRGRR